MGSSFLPKSMLSGLTTAGALLTCFAVVLNLFPLTKTSKPEAVRAINGPAVETASNASPQTSAATEPERVRSIAQTAEISAPVRTFEQPSSAPDFGGTPAPAAQAQTATEPAVETTSNPIPQTSTATEPERLRSIVQTAEISAPVRTFERPSSAPDFGSTPTPAAQAQAAIAGVWTPDASACSVRNFRDGLLPTLINTHGAWAGETSCIFSNQKQTQTGWDVVANCSNAREHWATRVRLTIKGDRLVWASKRGTQAYTRCPPDFLLAEAPTGADAAFGSQGTMPARKPTTAGAGGKRRDMDEKIQF